MKAIGKSFIHSTILLLLAIPAFSQAKETSSTKDNLYSSALDASISAMEKTWGYIDDSNHGRSVRTDYHHMIVKKDPDITDDLPTQFGGRHVEYLDHQALIDRYKTTRKEFSILEIHPVHSDGAQLRIQVTVSWAQYHRGKLMLALSDWSDVEFRYDCETKAFAISAVKLGGI